MTPQSLLYMPIDLLERASAGEAPQGERGERKVGLWVTLAALAGGLVIWFVVAQLL
jgi:hypothetical protein